jgi:hypothetical protein
LCSWFDFHHLAREDAFIIGWLPVRALLGTGSTGAVPAVFVLIFEGGGDFS